MKKRIIVLCASVCVLLGTVFLYNIFSYYYKINHPVHVMTESTGELKYYPKNLSELEELSQYILKVQVLPGSQNFPDLHTIKSHGAYVTVPRVGFTRTPLSIEKVYKSPEGFNAKILNIAEDTFEYTVPGKIIRINYENYRPMKVGQHYILFVRFEEDTREYYCVGSYQGKYLINDKTNSLEKIDSLTQDDMEVGDCGDLYKEILKDVIKKYK